VAVWANSNRFDGHAPDGVETHHALTENLDQPMGQVKNPDEERLIEAVIELARTCEGPVHPAPEFTRSDNCAKFIARKVRAYRTCRRRPPSSSRGSPRGERLLRELQRPIAR
jgi:hypothetical protein